MPVDNCAQLKKELDAAVSAIVRLDGGGPATDAALEAFHKLRRAMQQAASQQQDDLRKVFESVIHKEEVLRFLFAFHERKRQFRRQVAVVLAVLLRVGAWRQALESRADLRHALPADLQEVVKEAWEKAEPEPELSPVAGEAAPIQTAGMVSSEEQQRGSAQMPASAEGVQDSADVVSDGGAPSEADIRAAIERAKARAGLQNADKEKPIEAHELLALSVRQMAEVLHGEPISQRNARLESDVAHEVFQMFQKALKKLPAVRRSGSGGPCESREEKLVAEAFEQLEDKVLVLEFLLAFSNKRPKYKSLVSAVLRRMAGSTLWCEALAAEPALTSEVKAITAQPRPPSASAERNHKEKEPQATAPKKSNSAKAFSPPERIAEAGSADAVVEAAAVKEASKNFTQSEQAAVLQRPTQGSFLDGRWALICPWAHVINRLVDEAPTKKFFGLLQRRCELCGDIFGESEKRWTCSEECNFEICSKCYYDQPSGPGAAGSCASSCARSRARSSSLTLRRPFRLSSKTAVANPAEATPPSRQQQRRSSSLAGYSKAQVHIADVQMPVYMVQHDGDVVRFGIIVSPEGGGTQWMVFHRYNDFKRLNDNLCNTGIPFIDAPFPRRHMRGLNDERLEERRIKLEQWLRQAISRRPFPKEWAEPLQHFLNVAVDGRTQAPAIPGSNKYVP
mmetsp:Transcript_22614/g.52728  ORF Transcript_22614/g.52728 Transcript_22614/m.52728 type:complete len:679 (-) Transcript_22614:35-2071(-)